MAMQEENKKWTHNCKTLVINARVEMEGEFRGKSKKRVVLCERVLQKIKSIDDTFSFLRDNIYRKFFNFMVTYKRIKKRNKTSDEAATTWDFFDRLDEIYGSRTDISVPDCNLELTLDTLLSDLTDESNEPCSPEEGPSSMCRRESSTPARKRSRVDVVEFLTVEGKADRKVLEELLQCEKEKLKVETEKVEEIRKIREALLSRK